MADHTHQPARCIWCSGRSGTLVPLDGWSWADGALPLRVHPEHADAARAYLSAAAHDARTLAGLLFAATAVAAAAIAVALAWSRVVGVGLLGGYALVVGAALLRWPVAAPHLIVRVGARRSRVATRVVAGLALLTGALLLLAAWSLRA